jgi:hypothetical protein
MMNDQMKKTIRDKTHTYLKRAEEFKKASNKSAASASPIAASNANVPHEASADPDAIRTAERFKGQSYWI